MMIIQQICQSWFEVLPYLSDKRLVGRGMSTGAQIRVRFFFF